MRFCFSNAKFSVITFVLLCAGQGVTAQINLRWQVRKYSDLEIVPIVSTRDNSHTTFAGAQFKGRTIEVGLGALYGEVEECFLLGDWFYVSPFVSGEYTLSSFSEVSNKYSINAGISGARGGTFLALSLGVHASLSYSTDFNRNYLRGEIGVGCKKVNLSVGNYLDLSKNNAINSRVLPHGFVSLKFMFWGKGPGY